jgi:hypothetical protein
MRSEYFTLSEIAERLRCKEITARRWLTRYNVPILRGTKRVLVAREDLERTEHFATSCDGARLTSSDLRAARRPRYTHKLPASPGLIAPPGDPRDRGGDRVSQKPNRGNP